MAPRSYVAPTSTVSYLTTRQMPRVQSTSSLPVVMNPQHHITCGLIETCMLRSHPHLWNQKLWETNNKPCFKKPLDKF